MSFRGYTIVALATFGVLACLSLAYSRMARLTCWSGGYAQNAWMAYCNTKNYGVYDVDAIWFGIEPEVAGALRNAQVITLSNSRLQAALSLGGASRWFTEHDYRAYLLGLPGAESGFGELLWDKFKPRASVVIFDASPYFTGHLGYAEDATDTGSAARRDQALELRHYQEFHEKFCASLPALCGHNFSYFKARDDGHWIFPPSPRGVWINGQSVPNDEARYPTSSIPEAESPPYSSFLEPAERLIAKVGLPKKCIVITEVPSEETNKGLGEYLATRLGVTLIDPKLPNMTTFDHHHLSPQSAREWTNAFLGQLAPVLKACVAAH